MSTFPSLSTLPTPPVLPYPYSPYYCIDIECVATGHTHNDHAVGQVALVDAQERVVQNIYVRPETPIVSYLTPLSGLTKELLDEKGVSLENAVTAVRRHLPPSAILVGQGIRQDAGWLGLKEGVDFQSTVDLVDIFKAWDRRYGNYHISSLQHLCKCILGIQPDGRPHDAAEDAVRSMQLFKFYLQFHENSNIWEKTLHKLLTTPPPTSFRKLYPIFEGVCMGGRRCRCGAPRFFDKN